MPLRKLLVVMIALVWLWPVPARADWYISPFVGGVFGGTVAESPKVSVGASVGWTGDRHLGFEIDLGDSVNFFGATDIPKSLFMSSHVTTVMFNGVAELPWRGFGVRPYASGGIGLVRSRIGDDGDFVHGKSNSVGFNLGGGATGFFSEHVGVRGDVRYFRAVQALQGDSEFFSFGSTKVDFWRATGGVVFRF